MRVARDHLEVLARRDFAVLKRRLRVTREELDGALTLLRALNPRPGAGAAGPPTEYVTPDLRVFRVGRDWRVELNAGAIPKLRINSVYAGLVRRGDQGTENLSPAAAPVRGEMAHQEPRKPRRNPAPRRPSDHPAPVGFPRRRRGGNAAAGAARHRIGARPARIDRIPGDHPQIHADPARCISNSSTSSPIRFRSRTGEPPPPPRSGPASGKSSKEKNPSGPGATSAWPRTSSRRDSGSHGARLRIPGIDGDPALERKAPNRRRQPWRQRLIAIRPEDT